MELTPASERLISFLALSGPTPRHCVAFRLWPDYVEERSLGCLRTALWRLPRPGGDQLIRADAHLLQLEDGVEVDVHRRYAEAARWTDGTAPPTGLAIDGFSADILPDAADDWAVIEHEKFRQMRLHVLERLSIWYADSGRPAKAIEAARRAIDGGPLRESAYRCLVQAHRAAGTIDESWESVLDYFANLAAAGLPRHLSPAMTDLYPMSTLYAPTVGDG